MGLTGLEPDGAGLISHVTWGHEPIMMVIVWSLEGNKHKQSTPGKTYWSHGEVRKVGAGEEIPERGENHNLWGL